MAEAAVSIIPWAERKLVRLGRILGDKYQVTRRIQEYRQMEHWTKSSLRISTAFDWGHTCDLTEAINEAANHILWAETPFSWAFTSRTLVSTALGINIEREIWTYMVERILRNASKPVSEPERSHPAECGLLEGFLSYLKEIHLGDNFHDQDHDDDDDEFNQDENLEVQKETATRLVSLLENVYLLYHSGCLLERCCKKGDCSPRKRALQLTSCKGMNIKLRKCGCEGRLHEGHLIPCEGFQEMAIQWHRFVSNWDVIVRKASEAFSFPIYPGISDLIFHDMATGFVSSSAILRRGGKDSNGDGTTIVHPGERAAVVSSRCHILRIENSAVERNGIRREWGTAAAEFADYALLRCDLVKRSRMTFREAVNDWNSQYASWDRAPRTLSEWKGPSSNGDTTTDDMRLILLRQALGTNHSINIYTGHNNECTVFGGYISKEPESIGEHNGKAIVVDRALKLKVRVAYHIACRGRVIDTWGSKKGVVRNDGSEKFVVGTGRPDIFKLIDDDPLTDAVAMANGDGKMPTVEESRLLIFDTPGLSEPVHRHPLNEVLWLT